MIAAEPRDAQVRCSQCPQFYQIDLDKLRAMNERDELPVCFGCIRAAELREKVARQAAARQRQRVRLSKSEMILVGLKTLEDNTGETEFDYSVITVEAWNSNKTALGMPGYAMSYPDSNRVMMELVKLVRNGLLVRPAPRQYGLTDNGRTRAEMLVKKPK